MKFYVKILSSVLAVLILGYGVGVFLYIQKKHSEVDVPYVNKVTPVSVEQKPEPVNETASCETYTDLEKAVLESKRMNVLMMGTDGGRADTIMLFSYNPRSKLLDIVSIPRDTYNEVPHHTGLGQKKINSVLGYKGDVGGPKGLTAQVSKLLGVPIEYYVVVDYVAVRDVVDLIGGVEMDVTFEKDYVDLAASTPVHGTLKKGVQVLDGSHAIAYIRWRSDGQGDLNRINRQQEFVKEAIRKACSQNVSKLAMIAIGNVKTNLPLHEAIYYATEFKDLKIDELRSMQIPGRSKMMELSYYIHDPGKTETMMLDVYNR